jgi:hypothetical protein
MTAKLWSASHEAAVAQPGAGATAMKIPPPDLQELVELVGGYDKITVEQWTAFDHAMAEYQCKRREVKFDDDADPALAILAVAGQPERAWPYKRCLDCGREARFAYRDVTDGLTWWCCANHRRTQCWADARR